MRDLIRRLARPTLRLLGRDERGAVGVLVGVLLGGGVLLGIGALVIDAGQLYRERAELQNGADAGALAVAKSCAKGTCAPATAATYANLNAKDGVSAVTRVCGSGGLGGCPASSGTLVDCPAPPGGNYVDVHTATRTTGGSTLLPPTLARALLGNGANQGSTVLACARGAWGPALQSSSLALTLSYCVWNSLTQTGTTYGTDGILFVKGDPAAKPCSGPAGQNTPGGYGYLSSTGNCIATIDLTKSTSSSDPGNNVTAACQQAIKDAVANKTVLFVPLFVSVSGSGAGSTYTLGGLAAFVLTGYKNFGGSTLKPDVVPAGMNGKCTAGSVCIFGHFTQDIVPVTTLVGTGTNYGAVAVKLAG